MQKLVAVFKEETSIKNAAKELVTHDQADFWQVKLSDEHYEQQVRHEVFLTRWQYRTTWLGALLGAIAGGLLFYWLAGNHSCGMLVARFIAGGMPVAVFTGAGIGLAAGGLIAGLYALSKRFPDSLRSGHMLVLYAQEPRGTRAADKIIGRHGGKLL